MGRGWRTVAAAFFLWHVTAMIFCSLPSSSHFPSPADGCEPGWPAAETVENGLIDTQHFVERRLPFAATALERYASLISMGQFWHMFSPCLLPIVSYTSVVAQMENGRATRIWTNMGDGPYGSTTHWTSMQKHVAAMLNDDQIGLRHLFLQPFLRQFRRDSGRDPVEMAIIVDQLEIPRPGGPALLRDQPLRRFLLYRERPEEHVQLVPR